MSLRPMQLLGVHTGAELSVEIGHGFFVVLLTSELPQSAIAFYFEGDTIAPASVKQLLDQARKMAGVDFVAAKVIGDPGLIREVVQVLEAKHIRVDKMMPRKSAFTIIFHPAIGRVQLSRVKAELETQRKLRVLIVDDSRTMQTLLHKIISSDPRFDVVGAATRPSQVEEMIRTLLPDVITLDIVMPEMDGVTLLKQIIQRYKVPTVVVSSLGLDDGHLALDALEAGAIDYVQKPSLGELAAITPILNEKIQMAATANVRAGGLYEVGDKAFPIAAAPAMDTNVLVAMGASTGGTEALKYILTRLPSQIPPIVIVQHIPPEFSRAFAERLNELCPFEVKEAQNGDQATPNRVLIAPGGYQMWVQSPPSGWTVRTSATDPPVNRHKPSVDVLFHSCAEQIGKRCIGILLTGMGNDGAQGLLQIREAGGRTMAQDQKSSIVFGMPKQAIQLGAAQHITSLEDIPSELAKLLTGNRAAA